MKQIEFETGRVRVRTVNNEPSLTQQQFKDQCDINNILKQYKQTGQITHLARKQGVYADLSKITDYHSMVLQVQEANDAFQTLSAATRLRFDNDPGKLLEFIQDPANYEEGVKLGLFEPKKTGQVPEQMNDAIKRDEQNSGSGT